MKPRLILAAALLVGCSGDPGEIRRTAAERGAALFSSPSLSRNQFNPFACSTCHATAQHPAAGRRLPGADLDGVTARPHFWGGQEGDLLRSVNHCLRIFMLDSQGLTRDDPRASDLYAFLASLPLVETTPVPFTVVGVIRDVPVGDATRGGEIYGKACRSCHGTPHDGAGRLPGASLLPEETIAEHSDYDPLELRVTVIEKIRHGSFLGYAGRMPPFSVEVLSDGEVGDLLSYLGFLPP
ncbi:MAG: c-type cytochrome [Myxococcales bacterium]|nr:cytochrome c [Polyangiaceae bacterium]MDW8249119.1 c-type cytochrome [Myxococcales bacterium]